MQLRVLQQLIGVLVPMGKFLVREEGTQRRRRGCVRGRVVGEDIGRCAELAGDKRHEGE